MNLELFLHLDLSKVKGPKSLFRSLDLLRPITALPCDRPELEAAQMKWK